jgi:hypothetical protein
MSKSPKLPLRITHWSFQNIQIPTFPAGTYLTSQKSLDFSFNRITSLCDLETLSLLSRLNLSRALIKSFGRVKEQPSLTDVLPTNAPLENYQMSDIMCMIAFGKNVFNIHGNPIPKARRASASTFTSFLHHYRSTDGW